ncbi:MAG: hypothetical protein H8K04_07685 [Nitrospira sp.]
MTRDILKRMSCSAILVVPLCATLGWASEDDLFHKLLQTHSLKCKFSIVSQTYWEDGNVTIKTEPEKDFLLHFDSIDIQNRHARLLGNLGSSDVGLLLTNGSLSFLETTSNGGVNLTTIFPAYRRESREFIAVSSRHLSVFGPFPSQHHGSCQVWEGL